MLNMRKCTSANVNIRDKTDEPPLDWSVLKPVLSKSLGFQEAKSAYENGTDEIRRLLLHECSIIYECNICRNMFRNLANFISHKRIFCCNTYKFKNRFENQSSAIIIQEPETNVRRHNKNVDSSPKNTPHPAVNDSLQFLKTENSFPTENFHQEKDAVLQLERVDNSNKAVYQTLKVEENDSIKTEVNEVHKMLNNNDAIICSDGTALPANPYVDQTDYLNKHGKELQCTICQISFQTEKTLKLHIQKKHIPSTYVYQCPTCTLTFLQPGAVIRHLANEHKKSSRRIRLMRDTIFKRRIHISEIQNRKPNRELKRLQLDSLKAKENNKNIEQKPKSICLNCGKNFERRAVLSTHLLNCRSKIEIMKKSPLPTKRNRIESNSKLSMEEDKDMPDEGDIKQNKYIKIENVVEMNEAFENLDKVSFGSGLQTISFENLEMMDDENTISSNTEEDKSFSSKIDTSKELDSSASFDEKTDTNSKDQKTSNSQALKSLSCRCKICNKQFTALSNLRRHISMFHYRARKFGCKLCDYRAFRRYDIVNHLGFVHKMTGEREAMSIEYVSVHEVHYTKDDVESDIVLLTDEESKFLPEKCLIKRKKRTKTTITLGTQENVSDTEARPTRFKIKHQSSSLASTTSLEKRRPIRNRIKTVNNDFVYDLSHLLNTDQAINRDLKRRNTIPSECEIVQYYKQPLVDANADKIRGAAQRLTLTLVNQGLAASSTPPELPLERPIMRQNLTSTQRVDMQAGPIIETTELEAARLRTTLFDDSFLDKIAKRSNSSFKLKPCLELPPHRTLDSLLEKCDSSLQSNISKINKQQNGNLKLHAHAPAFEFNAMLEQTDELIENNIGDYIDPMPSIPASTSPPPTPKKRISLLERLAENKLKHRDADPERDSLLRSALQN